MILANLIVTTIYTGMSMAAVAALIVPLLLPFNVAKAVVNSVLAFVLYKSVSNMVRPVKEQVSGK